MTPDLDPERAVLGTLSLLPELANNVANCNSLPFVQDPMTISGAYQYAVWVSGALRVPLLARRELPDGHWSRPIDLGAFPHSPFSDPTKLDPHHGYSLGVAADGRLHLAGNCHNEPLRYARSLPGDPTRWETARMIGADEARVTYPAFASLPDGTLLFFYRDGRAGSGDAYLNRLRPGAHDWERVGVVVEGRRSGESPYLNHVAVGRDGVLHLSGCFRGKGGAEHNRDVWHVCSSDAGTSWQDAGGAPLEAPLTHGAVPIVVPTASHGSGLVNQMGMDVDPAGHPHLAYLHYDAAGATQVAVASHDGGQWHRRDITSLTHRMETRTPILDASVARAAIACTADGEVYAVFRATRDGRRGRVTAIRCTPGSPLLEIPLYDGDLGTWEPAFDAHALRDRDELHLLLTAAPPYLPGAYGSVAAEWEECTIGVLSVSAAELADAR